MKVLVACEESQAVTIELRKLGHEAYSCDIEPCSGGHPEWHIRHDVLTFLNGDYMFQTDEGCIHSIVGRWDMIIAHPPCTYLTVAGNRWFKPEYEQMYPTRMQDRENAASFFMRFVNADCERIAIENPICIMSTRYRKPDQIIQPFQFGHPYTKQTCLWLKGLQKLTPTDILQKPETGWENQNFTNGRYAGFGKTFGCNQNGKWLRYGDAEVKKLRSKTFPGIARAMAEQWAGPADIEGRTL